MTNKNTTGEVYLVKFQEYQQSRTAIVVSESIKSAEEKAWDKLPQDGLKNVKVVGTIDTKIEQAIENGYCTL